MDGRTTALPFVRREEIFLPNPLLPGLPQSLKIQAPSLGKTLHHSQPVVQLGAPVNLNELFQGAATHVKALATGLGFGGHHSTTPEMHPDGTGGFLFTPRGVPVSAVIV